MEHVVSHGRPIVAFSRDEVRALDRAAIEQYGIPDAVLMENAGRATAALALQVLGPRPAGSTLIVCGKGNNGGDGYVVARYLLNAGRPVRLFLAADPAEITGSAGVFLSVARKMGLEPQPLTLRTIPDLAAEASRADLIVDGLLGTGLSGEVRSPYREAIETLNASGRPILAIDIPSGLDADRGVPLGVAIKATRTATYAGAKLGFFRADGPALTGTLHVIDLGIPLPCYASLGISDLSDVFPHGGQ